MSVLIPIDLQLEALLLANISTKINHLRWIKGRSTRDLRKGMFSLRGSDPMTANKKTNDLIAFNKQMIEDAIKTTYELIGSVIQLGNTIDLSEVDNIEEIAFSDGYLHCYSDICQKYREMGGKI